MRVVCDNCGAVYKIADSKLSKEVNRATCKRCGHKIIIYKPGSQAAQNAAAQGGRRPDVGDDEERTVIKAVPELQKMASKQGVPSIGSLTAELRAISIPGIQSVGGPTPTATQNLGPAGPMAGDTRAPRPPTPIAPHPPSQPVVIPATSIPPSDSPKTKVYEGPSPHLGGQTPAPSPAPQKPPLVTTGRTNSTRPMPMPSPAGPVPSNGSPGPAARTGPAPAKVPPIATIGSPSTRVAPVAETGSSVLGGVAVFSMVGVVGLVAAIYVPPPASTFAVLLAALGLFGCFFLSLLTARGRKPERSLIALVLAFVLALAVGGMQFVASGGLDSLDPQPTPAVLKQVPPRPSLVLDTGAEVTGGQLDSAELEAVERYSDRELGGLAGRDEPEPTPIKESKRDVVTRPTPTPRPTSTPRAERPTPAPTPART